MNNKLIDFEIWKLENSKSLDSVMNHVFKYLNNTRIPKRFYLECEYNMENLVDEISEYLYLYSSSARVSIREA